MPVQTFPAMSKDFPTFDCDAHITEPAEIWERAKDNLTKDELDALKATMWYDADSKQLIVNGRAGVGIGSQRRGGTPGTTRAISTPTGPATTQKEPTTTRLQRDPRRVNRTHRCRYRPAATTRREYPLSPRCRTRTPGPSRSRSRSSTLFSPHTSLCFLPMGLGCGWGNLPHSPMRAPVGRF